QTCLPSSWLGRVAGRLNLLYRHSLVHGGRQNLEGHEPTTKSGNTKQLADSRERAGRWFSRARGWRGGCEFRGEAELRSAWTGRSPVTTRDCHHTSLSLLQRCGLWGVFSCSYVVAFQFAVEGGSAYA